MVQFNYCRNQKNSMTHSNGPQEFIYLLHHLPIGCQPQLNIFVREKMFPVVTFPPARKCFLPQKPASWRVRKTFSCRRKCDFFPHCNCWLIVALICCNSNSSHRPNDLEMTFNDLEMTLDDLETFKILQSVFLSSDWCTHTFLYLYQFRFYEQISILWIFMYFECSEIRVLKRVFGYKK